MKQIIIILLLTISNLHAQNVEVKWEQEKKGLKKYSPEATLYKKEGGFYVIGAKKTNEITIYNYDENAQILGSKEIELMDSEKNDLYFSDGFVTTDGTCFLIMWSYDYKTRLKRIYYSKIEENLELTKPEKLNIPFKVKDKEDGAFKIDYSPNHSQIFLKMLSKTESLIDANSLALRMVKLDSDFNIVWNELIKIKKNPDYFDLKDLKVNDNGTFVISGEEESKVTLEFAFKNILLLYDANGKFEKEFVLDTKTNHYQNVFIIPQENNIYKISCFYASNKHRDYMNGISTFELNTESKELKNLFSTDFDLEFLKNVYSEKKANSKDEKDYGISKDFVLKTFFEDQNNLYFVAEEEDLRATTLGGMITKELYQGFMPKQLLGNLRNYVLLYGKIMVFAISKTGEMQWSKAILKKQEMPKEDLYYIDLSTKLKPTPVSYACFESGSNILMIFNDCDKNQDYQNEEENKKRKAKLCTNFRKASCYFLNFSKSNGDMKQIKFFDGREEDLVVYPIQSKKISDNKFLIYSSRFYGESVGILHYTPAE
jgi:hypothetical protein